MHTKCIYFLNNKSQFPDISSGLDDGKFDKDVLLGIKKRNNDLDIIAAFCGEVLV